MQKTLMIAGALILLIGLAWPLLAKIGLFRLPGDMRYESGNVRVFIPLGTMLLLSIAISGLLMLWSRWRG